MIRALTTDELDRVSGGETSMSVYANEYSIKQPGVTTITTLAPLAITMMGTIGALQGAARGSQKTGKEKT